jgi:glycosyltransferase involved in cell wall biosynthesis
MSFNPFFSVIVPVYNKEKYVSRAISSILNQSFDDFELIIICDPSSDNSNLEVLKFHDSRIKIFNREIPGPGGYAARNLGIENSNGKWIAFLDADDEWYSNHLSEAFFK